MTVAERNALLLASLPVEPNNQRSRRFAIRRSPRGLIEIYDIKWTRDVDGIPEFHGHPASRVDRRILRQWRDGGILQESEYRRFLELPGC